jgi:hypothetical protein
LLQCGRALLPGGTSVEQRRPWWTRIGFNKAGRLCPNQFRRLTVVASGGGAGLLWRIFHLHRIFLVIARKIRRNQKIRRRRPGTRRPGRRASPADTSRHDAAPGLARPLSLRISKCFNGAGRCWPRAESVVTAEVVQCPSSIGPGIWTRRSAPGGDVAWAGT